MKRNGIPTLFLVTGGMIAILFSVVYVSQRHDLNSIQDRTVGHGQHGTARWATAQDVKRTYHHKLRREIAEKNSIQNSEP